jgi:poly-gamma-glutamate synthase PgsB/CapB
MVREPIDVSTWVAGWTSLGIVVLYGAVVIGTVIASSRARKKIPVRVLVTGTRGKSGTVRLLHAGLSSWQPTYAKITGTIATELFPDGHEVATTRVGTNSVSEIPRSMIRAARSGATVGVFECMAITPALIRIVQDSLVRARIVVIPTIRLDHLEEEGLTEFDIGKSIIDSIEGCEAIVTAVDQPDILEYFQRYCHERGIDLEIVRADKNTPVFPGHHPTNVAVSLAVTRRLGVDRKLALRGFQSVTLEPRAMQFQRVRLADGFTVQFVDLGGANDPQSAWEAIRSLGFDGSAVIPILVNRWERPLRSVSFFAGFQGAFPLVGVTGTLAHWMKTRRRVSSKSDGFDGEPPQYLPVTESLARSPGALVEEVKKRLEVPGNTLTLVLLENTHERVADVLRDAFSQLGETLDMTSEGELA